ncbi:branched-chain-amino-acid aminotransferase, cytosolic-like [Clavelina lepadiformis]|uniref:Branched-chain-amino-acid aminotransferase n=1 Tax=Clavelina lepadiformis TaxID=159417 RepID=A0ABP0EWW8_CLALP
MLQLVRCARILRPKKNGTLASIQPHRTHLSFKASDLTYRLTSHPKPKPANPEECAFGSHYTDHMLSVKWDEENGWGIPCIKPLENLSLHPATSVFHYAIELFEGMKAFHTEDNRIAMFRPMENMKRMYMSAERSCLPTFDQKELLDCISELVRVDQDWVPRSNKASLYIRPTMIGTEPSLGVQRSLSALLYCILSPVGPYFKTGTLNPVSLLADPKYIRAAEGGAGAYKLGSNYGPTISIQHEAEKQGFQQVLWLYGDNQQLTEVGTMNVFVFWINDHGDKELVTASLDRGLILPGVIRSSLLELAKQWGEFKVTEGVITMEDIILKLQENRILEIFGTGTACVVCPVERIRYMGKDYHIPTMENGPYVAKKYYKQLTDIQYGKVQHEWSHTVVDNVKK